MITTNEIESSAAYRDDDMIESSVALPILGRDVTVVLYLDPDHKTISDRHHPMYIDIPLMTWRYEN